MTDDVQALGRRVAQARKRRGLSQRELARLLDRSETWLSQVERGVRKIDRMSVLERVAEVLEVPLTELAPDRPVVAAAHERPAAAVNLTLALSSSNALAAVLADRSSANLRELTGSVDQAWSLVHAAEYERVSDLMMRLLPALEFAARASDGEPRSAVYAALARTYHACAAVLSKLGEPSGAWVSADRAIAAAERSGDALLMAEGAFRLSLVFQSARLYGQVIRTASTAVDALAGRVAAEDPAAISLSGSMLMQMAITEARRNNADQAYAYLVDAERLAQALGTDRNDYGTEFGPTNVTLHQVTVAVELGDAGRALRIAADFDPGGLSPERRSRYQVELARAHAQRRDAPAAVAAIRQAYEIAPELVVGHPTVHALLTDLLRTEGGQATDVRDLARQVGMTL
ncbi:XRE family transcriptional regulator [Jiangella ureilytica]|uniref:XRE family transcriptional regulator n=1 Tax=Jiangella ureilytica TaxID=2530374 RepID=A0A4R4RXA3_9ACTN|nr:helix-turn-helix transcriptional regulator [Jiangella ureilytica]TDC54374.1 XRE family transcriptional regulator [Jiangella ureilytica]